jgi:ribosomal protein S18 acetylase RimI-like enzyme
MTAPNFRAAGPADADGIALLHAGSWRRNYRGAYSDAFLDGDVEADRRVVWSSRLAAPEKAQTIVAEHGDQLAGFVHVVFDADDQWGSLVDNLHVIPDCQRTGIGRELMRRAGVAVVAHATTPSLFLWVLEQNTSAQRFYRALGGIHSGTRAVPPVGGVEGRLNGSPRGFRMTWPDVTGLVETRWPERRGSAVLEP